MKLSEYVQTNCCGTTCDKGGLVKRIAELEARCADQQKEIDEYNRLRGNKEAFARKVFMAGFDSSEGYPEQAWLNFKATEL